MSVKRLEKAASALDRAVVVLCARLPEELGEFRTIAEEDVTLRRMRGVSLLEHIVPNSKKHIILRDWMRSYEKAQDAPMDASIDLAELGRTMQREQQQRASIWKDVHKMMISSAEDAPKDTAKSSRKEPKQPNPQQQRPKKSRRRRMSDSDESESEEYVPSSSSSSDSDSDASEVSASATKRSDSGSSSSSASSSSEDSGSSSDASSDESSRRAKRKHKPSRRLSRQKQKQKQEKKKKQKQNQKKKRKISEDSPPPVSDQQQFDPSEPDVYFVEAILAKRRSPDTNQYMYLVKWVGYTEKTWEPAENIPRDLRRSYDLQLKRQKADPKSKRVPFRHVAAS